MSRTRRNWHATDSNKNRKRGKSKRRVRQHQRERKYDKGFTHDK